MRVFAQIRKVDEEKRLVTGRIADESVDKADEVMDYLKSKPHFQKWSSDIAKDTDGKSLGNVRAMHGKVAAGKLTDIGFDDTACTIDVCAKIVDDQEWKKVMEGVYTGFSIGGKYGDKAVEKIEGRDVTRYVAMPSEVSLVDRPCIPTAKFFEIQKIDGTLAKVEFQTPEEEQPDATIEGTPEQIDEMVKLMNEQKLNVTAVTEMLKGFDFKAMLAAKKKKEDAKGDAKEGSDKEEVDESDKEAKDEGDKADAKKAADAADLAKVEADKLVTESLTKIVADVEVLAKAGARNSKADMEKIQTIHDHSAVLGAACSAAKSEATAGLEKVAEGEAMGKAIASALEPLNKLLAEAAEKIAKLESQPAPARVMLRAVSKAEDNGGGDAALSKDQSQPIVDSRGEAHETAGLIKSIHQAGGAPLMFQK